MRTAPDTTQPPQASASTNSAIRAESSIADEESQETGTVSRREVNGVKFQEEDFSQESGRDRSGNQTAKRQENDRTPSATRFWRKVDKATSGCWEWTGLITNEGYGKMNIDTRPTFVHRYAWTLMRGEIPVDMTIDHLCRNRRCVNPDHLEVVTREENGRRAVERPTHCKRGHEFTEENTRLRASRGGARVCRACMRWHYHHGKGKSRVVERRALRALAEGKP